MERTIKIKGYTVEETIVDEFTKEERPHSRIARQGETIEVTEEEAERGDALGYFVVYDEVDEDDEVIEASVPDMSDDELDIWIAGDEDNKAPTNAEVIAAAENDVESAERLLASENRVAASEDRDVRVGIEKGLAEVIGQ